MNCAIMQPTFLPWAGYFNLMSQVDNFILLDDVQLEKQSWQTRNLLLLNGDARWVSLPVKHDNLSQSIRDTEFLDTSRWSAKLMRSFQQNYGKHIHYAAARDILDLLEFQPEDTLSTFNEQVIRETAKRLGIRAHIHRAGDLRISGKRSARLISICQYFDAEEYLSPVGSADYLSEDSFAEKTTISLKFQKYKPLLYPQKGSQEFVSHLSIVDVVANLGWDGARQYILKGVIDE